MKRLTRLLMADGKVNPAGGSGAKEARDSACTPKWLADLIGKVDLDVASNERAHILAAVKLTLESGDNGIQSERQPRSYSQSGRYPATVKPETRVFCNPPYARGQVIRWVKHWRTTNFIFLLRWDPSTEWFAELIHHCTHVWFPARRINFEPPPGVTFSSNPFPHALYLRNPDKELLGRLSTAGYVMPIDEFYLDAYLEADEQRQPDEDDDPGGEGEDAKGGTGGSGGGTGGGATDLQPKGVKYESDLAKWLPASKPTKYDLIKKYSDPYGYPAQYDDYKWWLPDYTKDNKPKPPKKGCGACNDCIVGQRDRCSFGTSEEYRKYIRRLQGWE